MEWTELSADSSRIFLSTESANSLFNADVDHGGSVLIWASFHTLLDADESFGSSIRLLAFDCQSDGLYLGSNDGLYRVQTAPATLTLEAAGMVQARMDVCFWEVSAALNLPMKALAGLITVIQHG